MNAQVSFGPTKVYQAIATITGELAKIGIAKGRKNTQQGYQFRGIDDVYSALSGLLAAHRLCVIPRVQSRSVTERPTKDGKGTLFYTVVDVEYDLVSAEDGSKHTARTVGEAMDSGDKSSNKAMSAAYKYFALQTFCIPTEGDNDADAQTHEVGVGISQEQRETLQNLLQEVGSDARKLCSYLHIDSLDQIPAAHYANVEALVKAKKKANAAHHGA